MTAPGGDLAHLVRMWTQRHADAVKEIKRLEAEQETLHRRLTDAYELLTHDQLLSLKARYAEVSSVGQQPPGEPGIMQDGKTS